MRRLLLATIATLLAATSAPAEPAGTGALPEGVVRLQPAPIVDSTGFEKPLVATTLLVPVGWQSEGGIAWGQNPSCGTGWNIQFETRAPDGLSAAQIIPIDRWRWSSSGPMPPPGCPSMQITSTRAYIEHLVQQARPGARMLEYRRRPDLEEPFAHLVQTTPLPLGESRTWVESGEALIGYAVDGVEMREIIAEVVVFSVTTTYPAYGAPGSEILSASSLPGFAMRAPEGKLDRVLAEAIRKSGRENPEWASRIARHEAKIAGINIAGARERARITAETSEEIRQMQTDSWRRESESFDRMSRESSEAIRGVETYDDPYHGGTVQLDHGYERAWQLPDGSYVLSNDANFEPGRDLGVDANRLEVTE